MITFSVKPQLKQLKAFKYGKIKTPPQKSGVLLTANLQFSFKFLSNFYSI
jgi:hypothetical protein